MKLGTSTECLLGTLEPSATLPLLETPFLNLYLELSLGTSELGTSWNFETLQDLSLKALVAWNLHLKPDLEPLLGPFLEPRNLPKPNRAWNLPNLYLEPVYLWTSWILHLQLGTSKLYLEPLLKTFETAGAFIWNPYLEPWNLPKLYLRTFAGNLDRHLEPSRTYTLTWMEPICFTWNLGIFRNLYLEPLLRTSEPSGTLYDWNPYFEPRNLPKLYLEPLYLEPRNLRNLTWNPYLEPRNLPEPLLGTLILGTSEPSEPYLEPLLGTSEPAGTFTWNPYSEPRKLPEPLLGTLTWNLGARRNLYLEPLLGTSEPAGTFILGTLTWNLGTCWNLYSEPLLGTSEPARTWRDDCPRVPQGLVWLGPQSFQLLGKNVNRETVPGPICKRSWAEKTRSFDSKPSQRNLLRQILQDKPQIDLRFCSGREKASCR